MAFRRINVDWPLVGAALALSLFGIAMVYSAGLTDRPIRAIAGAYKAQTVWLIISITAAFALSRASVRMIEWMTVPLYALAIVLLVVVLLFGSGGGTAASVKGWLTIGGKRLGQPAEFAKLAVVLMLARVLAQRRTGSAKSMFDLWKPILTVSVPMLLILMQPDLGTAIVFVGIFFAMLFWAGTPWKLLILLASPVVSLILAFNSIVWGSWLILVLLLVFWYRPYLLEGIAILLANVSMGIVAPLLWDHMPAYQQNRLKVFLDPTIDPRGSGYHVTQSRVAIGSGGWFGQGFTEGPQKRLAFLPEQHTDFIFAVVGEELGYLGVTVALTLFLFLFLRIVRVAERANDSFSSLVAFGLLASWFTHVAENVGMTLNLLPITGIPLPFFSYGGSFLLASWMAVGILARISSEGRGGGAGQLRI
ncbi:MAG TPA: rod shape-determining protein RodA [Gemmatimonadaceae bacterium]|nr:rod shape-determining protein RodA [Gemmatimonadaceae bacterium]